MILTLPPDFKAVRGKLELELKQLENVKDCKKVEEDGPCFFCLRMWTKRRVFGSVFLGSDVAM